MEITGKNAEILQLLTEHELALQQLYLIFAEQFADYEDFWRQLADEEGKHAEAIRALMREAEAGNIKINEERFRAAAIERSLRYIFDLCERADKGEINLNNSLAEAFHIEDAMIENRFFEIFEGDSAELKQTLTILQEATASHRQHVKEALEAARRS